MKAVLTRIIIWGTVAALFIALPWTVWLAGIIGLAVGAILGGLLPPDPLSYAALDHDKSRPLTHDTGAAAP